ncbi:hypothetical protein ACFJIX_15475 [Roseateles sp. UC29_93]|uniref:hypothetical protein n=1 Tax=Roseateles sp. UC29_93 TaxID=3350177 RepID=UPI00366BCC41
MKHETAYDVTQLIAGSEIDGWRLGYVGAPWPGPWPKRNGDLFIQDPSGGQVGIAWESEGPDIARILGVSPGRRGVYQVRFPHPVRSEKDLTLNFHAVLPLLKRALAAADEQP